MPGAEEQEKEEVCALFATTAPRDIWANPSLAAIAALIDEDEEQEEDSRRGTIGSTALRGCPLRLGQAAPAPLDETRPLHRGSPKISPLRSLHL